MNWIKKHTALLLIILAILAVLVRFYGAALSIRQSKSSDYNFAVETLKEGYYNTAIDIFRSLGDFQDAQKYVSYLEGILALQGNQPQSAIETFTSLGNFQDAQKYASYSEGILALQNDQPRTAIEIFTPLEDFQDTQDYISYSKAILALQDGQLSTAVESFKRLGNFQKSTQYLKEVQEKLEQESPEETLEEQQYNNACSFLATGNYAQAHKIFLQLGDYEDSQRLAEVATTNWRLQLATTISAGVRYSGGVREDNTVAFSGFGFDGQDEIENWTDIVSISAGSDFIVGLKSDGTVTLALRKADYRYRSFVNVDAWENIVSVSTGDQFIVGLKSDGTLVSTGIDGYGETKLEDWESIVSIDTGWQHIVGLDQDGKVHVAGFRADELQQEIDAQIEMWTDIVAISTGGSTGAGNDGRGHIVALKKDGSVVAVGDNSFGQCDVTGPEWQNIVAISAGDYHTVALTKDGHVLTTQSARRYPDSKKDIDGWTDIISVSAGYGYTLALKETEKGRFMESTGLKDNGQRNVALWKNIAFYAKPQS